MHRDIIGLACLSVLTASVALAAQNDVPATWWQFQAGENEERGLIDLLVPLHASENQVWLLNPRYSLDDDSEEEANLGLVYRCLLPDYSVIVGANLYYDSRWTRRDSHFSQMGIGVEALSRWLDFRANYYLPENKQVKVDSYYQQQVETQVHTVWSDPYARKHQIRQKGWRITESTVTTRLFERFEQAREGYDWELGVRLPLPDPRLEVRVYGGYYHWDAEYSGEPDLCGPKARLEARVLPALYLDALWFDDKDLEGSRWMAGCRVRLNCDLAALARGENPFKNSFARQSSNLRARLYEMVIRDPKIRTEDSGYRENPAATTTTVQVIRERVYHTVLDDVNFVDADNPGYQNGTAEHPYTSIQTAVDNAFGDRNVYVYAASAPYQENVVLRTSTTIIGQGYRLRGRGGKTFGGDRRPLLDGRGVGPAVIMADNSALYGMHIINTDTGGPGMQDPVYGIANYETFGVYAGNVSDFYIADNLIENCGHGMVLVCNADRDFNFQLRDNTVQNTDGEGLLAMGESFGHRSTVVMRGNRFINTDGRALNVHLSGYNPLYLELADSRLQGSTDIGGYFELMDTGDTTVRFSGLAISQNSAEGLYCMADVTGRLSVAISDIMASNNGSDGIAMDLMSSEDLDLNLSGVEASHNYMGIGIQSVAVGQNRVILNDISAASNELAGLGVVSFSLLSNAYLFAGWDTGTDPAGGNITLVHNGIGASLITAAAGDALLALNNISLTDNTNYNLDAYVLSIGDAVAVMNRVNSRGSLEGNYLHMNAGDLCAASIAFSGFVQSGGNGMVASVRGSNIAVYVRNTVFAENSYNGFGIVGVPGSVSTELDIGGGTLGSPGMNSFYDNSGIGLNNLLGTPAAIRYNYWGGTAPSPGTDYFGATDPGADWLAQDPNL